MPVPGGRSGTQPPGYLTHRSVVDPGKAGFAYTFVI